MVSYDFQQLPLFQNLIARKTEKRNDKLMQMWDKQLNKNKLDQVLESDQKHYPML